ncbi:DegT/DnrJ/EryC1/StrS aminotransferase family-domain-containing protein [Tricladium varicosporioides]|nr:DegT/DnrJ/EryC1/StrS aminotransferase family-domain-containing protein [Hymenoscyphus varicosporioides]
MAFSEPLPRIAVVGCGQWGQNLVRNFAKLQALDAIVDAIPSRADKAAEQLISQGYNHAVKARGWESVLADHSISAVVLATPAPQHADMAVAALNAGKHVFVEKPLALTVTDGERIQDAAHKARKIVMVGHSFQYHPAFLKLKSLVDQGELGRLLHIHSRRLGFGRIRHEEDVSWSLAPHDISMILALAGQFPTAIQAKGVGHLRPHIADVTSADLTFANGLHAQILVSWIYPEKERKLIVVGERAMAVFDDCETWERKLRVFYHRVDWATGFPEPLKGETKTPRLALKGSELLADECCHFLDCIKSGTKPLTSIDEGLAVVRVLCGVGEVLRQGPKHATTPTCSTLLSPALVGSISDDNAKCIVTDKTLRIPLIDLAAQKSKIQDCLRVRLAKVLNHMEFIMGPEVGELENRLCAYSGAAYTITCASGTDALTLALLALRVQPGDAVLVPAFTFVATVEPVVLLGAVPVFVDVNPDSLTIEPALISAGVTAARHVGLRPVGIIAVDLFGHPADYEALRVAAVNATAEGLWIIADAAQSFGASINGRRVGTLADITTTSFFPSKPLGCYGDGGAVFTDNAEIATALRSLRLHGRGTEKFDNIRIGLNSRLDTLQAAVLLCKLDIFDDEIVSREQVASRYTNMLRSINIARPPIVREGVVSAWASYTVRTTERACFEASLKAQGIATAIYYPRPIHKQPAYQAYPVANGSCAVAECACSEVLSIPMHPYLESSTQKYILATMESLIYM